jgi:hypothetical protein
VSAEDYLLGRAVTEIPEKGDKKGESDKGRKPIIPVIRTTYATDENEAFSRTMEDPLVYIKQKELEQRSQVLDNPLTIK